MRDYHILSHAAASPRARQGLCAPDARKRARPALTEARVARRPAYPTRQVALAVDGVVTSSSESVADIGVPTLA